jgi:hypothetical protein
MRVAQHQLLGTRKAMRYQNTWNVLGILGCNVQQWDSISVERSHNQPIPCCCYTPPGKYNQQ